VAPAMSRFVRASRESRAGAWTTVRLPDPRGGRKGQAAEYGMLAERQEVAKRIPPESAAREGDVQGLRGPGPLVRGRSAPLHRRRNKL
jgi:hypothetical protein